MNVHPSDVEMDDPVLRHIGYDFVQIQQDQTVGEALARLATQLPLHELSLDEQVAIRRFRQEAEWRAVRGDEVTVFAPPTGLNYTVVYDARPAFVASPLNRTLSIKAVESLADLPPLLAPMRSYLEGAGVAAPPSRADDLSKMLSAAGVHRVCRLGEMQRPDLRWRPGGRPRVAEWIAA